ncbi:MAG: hypothetical protein ACLP2P_07200 [Desulfobaccales bacterium]
MKWIDRHPKTTILIVNFIIIISIIFILEICLRYYINYNPGYYTCQMTDNKHNRIYPYGIIKINNYGYPDDNFDLNSSLQRIGYMGDSVCYGVGAGYGYRISDILKKNYPNYNHMTFDSIADGMDEWGMRQVWRRVRQFKLNKVVYLLNLNDILPDKENREPTFVTFARYNTLSRYIDKLRGQSYLYNYIRNKIKIYITQKGYEASGYTAYELFPAKNEWIIKQTASRINKIYRELANEGVDLIVIILPYEMQISNEAERKYRELHIKWEDDFIDRGTQIHLIKYLDHNIKYFDAYYAFIKKEDIEGSRRENKLGEYFVYNAGDKLDWNHPNRKGHKAIAQFLIENSIFNLNQ